MTEPFLHQTLMFCCLLITDLFDGEMEDEHFHNLLINVNVIR